MMKFFANGNCLYFFPKQILLFQRFLSNDKLSCRNFQAFPLIHLRNTSVYRPASLKIVTAFAFFADPYFWFYGSITSTHPIPCELYNPTPEFKSNSTASFLPFIWILKLLKPRILVS